MFSLEEIDNIVEKGIYSLDFKGEPKELYEPIEYLISLGGKRIRPKLSIAAYNLFSNNIDNHILFPSFALEIFHGFTLIHDDIMDGAHLRRRQLTVHKKWNENIAILSGDVACIKAYQYLSHSPKIYLDKVLSLFSQTAVAVCEGQQYDMNFEALPFITSQDYMDMIGLKTAVLIACAAKMGALIGGADDKTADTLYNYGYQIGLAFQIKDDFLDVYGDSSKFGKEIGGDILNNKKTWMLVNLTKSLSGRDTATLSELLKTKSITDEDKISGILSLYNKYGIGEAALTAIDGYHKTAIESIRSTSLNSTQIEQLSKFADRLIMRES